MHISTFGLGYVGCVGMGCLAKMGHSCIGVDVNPTKIEQINAGKPTIVEKDIDTLIAKGKEAGLIRATSSVHEAVHNSEISFICVGTPNSSHGHLNLEYVYRVAAQIAKALKGKNDFHVVAIRSTVLPGTNEEVVRIIEKESGKKHDEDFAVVSNPEFLREGSAVADYFQPVLTVIGTQSEKARKVMSELYGKIDTQIECVPVKVAEIIKYVNNTYHALKITFANEVGNICKKLAIDSHEVMRLFCQDTKLNISGKYFLPGFAYGGSCLPKDLKGLCALSHDFYLDTPVIENIEKSNFYQKELALDLILEQGKKQVGFLGLSFKAGTDDLRNSPAVELVERLMGKGFDIRVYDPNVHLSNLTGTNKEEIQRRIPHISELITDKLHDVVQHGDVLVISYGDDAFVSLIDTYTDKLFIDFARVDKDRKTEGNYIGIAW